MTTLGDLFTDTQIRELQKAYPSVDGMTKIIQKHIKSINRKSGQENDPRYLAYAVSHIFNQAKL